jgi:hypothetical protein
VLNRRVADFGLSVRNWKEGKNLADIKSYRTMDRKKISEISVTFGR